VIICVIYGNKTLRIGEGGGFFTNGADIYNNGMTTERYVINTFITYYINVNILQITCLVKSNYLI